MIEVAIWFGTVDGDGCETFNVNIEPDGFHARAYFTAINRATHEFSQKRPRAIISRVETRRVPPHPAILEVEP